MQSKTSLAVLTSGGDAPGMNAAVRAVVRTGLAAGAAVYAVYEGYQGLVDGNERIRPLHWSDVAGILHRGGTVIGSARCQAFREREGRRQAAYHLAQRGIDRLVVIGGDGSLTGADLFRQEWPELLAELQQTGQLDPASAAHCSSLRIAGLVGSIDNDMFGTDMTIGADTALHRIVEAIDAITSTATSHQRTFVVEVMGRNCGYLALMSAQACAADWVLIPERPPAGDDWQTTMCQALQAGRAAGRRNNIVIIAEGARDGHGQPISSQDIQRILIDRLQQDVRITVLGHVQRGGAPSAYDRCMASSLGYAAARYLLADSGDIAPVLIGVRGNRIVYEPLMDCVEQTRAVAATIERGDYDQAMQLRGGSFSEEFRIFRTLAQAYPHAHSEQGLRLAILNAGGLAPGMNTAVRAAVRLGLDRGHHMIGIRNGFQGLIEGDVFEMDWMSVLGWASVGGSGLGTRRTVPEQEHEFQAIDRVLQQHAIQGLLIIGGWDAQEAALRLYQRRSTFTSFAIPLICLPASIANNLPGSELSIGADTALNNIIAAIDKIKQSAVAAHRSFLVEVMGEDCGYLALISSLACGAECLYLPEDDIRLQTLQDDLEHLRRGFRQGKRVGLLIRSEHANDYYDIGVMQKLFEAESDGLFEVRQAVLGHLQQGGDPSPFDRIQATRLAARCIDFLDEQARSGRQDAMLIGLTGGQAELQTLADLEHVRAPRYRRPRNQWWLTLHEVASVMAQAGPQE